MNLYAESSAVLAWLLAEPRAEDVRRRLRDAEHIVTSDLTIIECERALLRAVALQELAEKDAEERRAELRTQASAWHRLRIDGEIVARAAQPFPGHPIRTLDAIHLASALIAATALPDLRLLTLDRRLQDATRALGLVMEP